MTEPVTAHTRRFVRCVWSLDRDLAYARHYPAVSWRESSSRDADARRRAGTPSTAIPTGPSGATAPWRCWPRPTGSSRSPSSSAPRRCPTASASLLLTGRLLREAVLQQNALSANDAWSARRPSRRRCWSWCSRSTTARLELVERGVAADRVEALDLSDAIRARDRVGPDDAAGVRADPRRAARAAGDARMRAARSSTRGVASIHGPLVVVEDVAGVGWDEVAEVRLDSGEVRHGVVLDVHDDLAVVEVFEGTSGIGLDSARVAFSGSPMRIPVGEDWLGRVCNGRGEPIDGGPPIVGEQTRPVAGEPINPAAPGAADRRDRHRRLGDRRARHARARAEAADLLRRRPAAPRAGRAGRRAGDAPAASRSRSSSRRSASRTPTRPTSAPRWPRAPAPAIWSCCSTPPTTRSSSGIVTPQRRADDRRAPRVRPRPPRAGRDGRPDQLLRGAARGLGGARRDPLAPRLPRLPLQRPRLAARARGADPRAGHGSVTQLPGADHAGRRHHPSRPRHHRLHHRGPARAGPPSCTPRACIRRSTRSARCRG